jgi:uncharacterized membrane protein (DUF485 family)
MARSVHQGLTVGYCLALTQFVVVGVLGLAYLRRADRVYDPLAAKVVRRALNQAGERAHGADAQRQAPEVTAR